jgi:tricorn protease
MLQHPAVSADHIAFVYGGDLWVVPREGGLASPVVAPPGMEQRPRFSPDGQRIAFTGNYDGGRDL